MCKVHFTQNCHSWRNGLIWKHLDVVKCCKSKAFLMTEKKSKPGFYVDTSAKHQEGIKHCIQWIELQKRMHSQTNININLSHKVGNIPAYLLAISLTATFLHLGGMQMTAAFPIPVFYRGKHLYSWRYKVISPQQVCIWMDVAKEARNRWLQSCCMYP